MKNEKVYINGQFVPEHKAGVSVFDRGLNYGDGIFETMKAFEGRIIFVKAHLARLKSGLRTIGFPFGSVRDVEKELKGGTLEKLLKINGLTGGYAYLKVMVTRGPDRGGHFPPKKPSPTVIAMCRRLDIKALSKYRKTGVRVTLTKEYARALPAIKALNFLPNICGKHYAHERGAFEAIFVDGDSNLIEGTSTNIFIVKEGIIKTPPAGKASSFGALPGIMRKNVIKSARKIGIPIVEAPVHMKDLLGSEEAFLTNSMLDIVPVVRLDSRPVGTGKPGDITRRLQMVLSDAMNSIK